MCEQGALAQVLPCPRHSPYGRLPSQVFGGLCWACEEPRVEGRSSIRPHIRPETSFSVLFVCCQGL
jgi:hypothetical protein